MDMFQQAEQQKTDAQNRLTSFFHYFNIKQILNKQLRFKVWLKKMKKMRAKFYQWLKKRLLKLKQLYQRDEAISLTEENKAKLDERHKKQDMKPEAHTLHTNYAVSLKPLVEPNRTYWMPQFNRNRNHSLEKKFDKNQGFYNNKRNRIRPG